ncbi:glycosyltransferase [Formosa sp. 4Alg 33]|uniref:glycosyltransferase n=1 Tax=Formosa sp. 4Alg 33 TaxID=3382189 RepID=UPI003D9C2487
MTDHKLIVLIPHYNNIDGLKTSLASIREDFNVDVLVVDDGSKIVPRLEELNLCFSKGQLYLEVLTKNMGIEHALNHGLNKIKKLNYQFIGRLDSGDICHINRFKIQLDYLLKNPEIKLLGTQLNYISPQNEILYKSNLPTSYEKLKKTFYINCEIIHPTVIFNAEVIDSVGLYPTNYKAAEDYGFFFKILKVFKSENLDIVLLDKIVDDNAISVLNRRVQIKSKIKIIKDNFYLGILPVYGIFRNIISLCIPYKVLLSIKKILFK